MEPGHTHTHTPTCTHTSVLTSQSCDSHLNGENKPIYIYMTHIHVSGTRGCERADLRIFYASPVYNNNSHADLDFESVSLFTLQDYSFLLSSPGLHTEHSIK